MMGSGDSGMMWYNNRNLGRDSGRWNGIVSEVEVG